MSEPAPLFEEMRRRSPTSQPAGDSAACPASAGGAADSRQIPPRRVQKVSSDDLTANACGTGGPAVPSFAVDSPAFSDTSRRRSPLPAEAATPPPRRGAPTPERNPPYRGGSQGTGALNSSRNDRRAAASDRGRVCTVR